jgi:hypothetical protein
VGTPVRGSHSSYGFRRRHSHASQGVRLEAPVVHRSGAGHVGTRRRRQIQAEVIARAVSSSGDDAMRRARASRAMRRSFVAAEGFSWRIGFR